MEEGEKCDRRGKVGAVDVEGEAEWKDAGGKDEGMKGRRGG